MIIQLTDRFSLAPVLERLDQLGLRAQVVQWEGEPLVVAPGGEPYEQVLKRVRGVSSLYQAPESYELASRGWIGATSSVRVGPAVIGGGRPALIAGLAPGCGPEKLLDTARDLAALGADVFYGGNLTPPATPYGAEPSAQGMLRLLAEVRRETGLPFIAQVAEPEMVAEAAWYADMLEIGRRSMENLSLLRAVGRAGKPVLLRRGAGSSLESWLLAAEFILVEGNGQIALCEEGTDGPDSGARHMLDITVVPRLGRMTHLPVLVDAGRGAGDAAATGDASAAGAVARAAVAAGADGVLLEVVPQGVRAEESLGVSPADLPGLIAGLHPLLEATERLRSCRSDSEAGKHLVAGQRDQLRQ